jgi:hypothetical protein
VAEKAECWREVLKRLTPRAGDGDTAGPGELEGAVSVTKREPAVVLGYGLSLQCPAVDALCGEIFPVRRHPPRRGNPGYWGRT